MEGRSLSEVTHLALLGVKIRETAFWDNAKEDNKGKGCKGKGQSKDIRQIEYIHKKKGSRFRDFLCSI